MSKRSHAARQKRYRERLKAKRDGDAVTPVTPVTPEVVSDAASPVSVTPSASPAGVIVSASIAEELEQLRAQHEEMRLLLDEMSGKLEERRVERDGLEARIAELGALDAAVAPFRETIKKMGFTEAQAIEQAFRWQMALASPQKVPAFRALMQNHGVTPEVIAAPELEAAIAPWRTANEAWQVECEGLRSALAGQAPANGHQATAPVTWDDLQRALEPMQRRLRVDRARHAGQSMRTAPPDVVAAASQTRKEEEWTPKNTDSPRESITKALAKLRG